MFQLFYEGGILFMSILTLCLLVMLVLSVSYALKITKSDAATAPVLRHRLTYIKSTGLLALVLGILGQLIGLFSGFGQIQQAGGVSQTILVAGLKVSLITTIYGIFVFIISYVIWLFLDRRLEE
jgi:biopolymer transport protein ExbB/TolQ